MQTYYIFDDISQLVSRISIFWQLQSVENCNPCDFRRALQVKVFIYLQSKSSAMAFLNLKESYNTKEKTYKNVNFQRMN